MTTTKKKTSPYGLTKFSTIDEYHASLPTDIQKILQQLRQTIKQVAPQATEIISYNIPTSKLNKNLVHYAAYKGHIGFYPTSSPLTVFKDELADFKTSKGAIQFPIDKPLPTTLINKIVKYRIEQDNETTSNKKNYGLVSTGINTLKAAIVLLVRFVKKQNDLKAVSLHYLLHQRDEH